MSDNDVADWLEGISEKSPAAALAAQMIRSQDPEANIQELFAQAQQMVDDFAPDHPEHPDFVRLARIVREMDEVAERGGWESVFVPVDVDGESVAYMAKQRVIRAQKLLSEADIYDQMAILWIDAFTAGVRLAQEKAPTITQLLDQSIDGNRRSGGTRG